MSKRHMTDQQRRRIQAGQSKLLEQVGTTSALVAGLVLANMGKDLLVYETTSEKSAIYPKRPNLGLAVVGDRVYVEAGLVSAILPRQHILYKYPERGGGRPKPLAANIDQIVIVVAPLPVTPALALDRILLSAEYHGIPPLLLFNKQDLLESSTLSNKDKQAYLALREQYHALPYAQADLSVLKQQGLINLPAYLQGRTSLFLGQSGVGKSSLIQYLSQDEAVLVGALSEKHALGKHTTSVSRWYFLDKMGTAVVDSPGIRMLSLPRLDREALVRLFVEFRPYIGACRFRNCEHGENSLGCAILAAVHQGQVSQSRLTSYWQLHEEMS